VLNNMNKPAAGTAKINDLNKEGNPGAKPNPR
jgi:hypothetical protein